VNIPAVSEFQTAALRTTYGDQTAWQATWQALTAAYPTEAFEWDGARLFLVESPELDGLAASAILDSPRDGWHSAIVVIDAQSLRDHTALVLNTLGGDNDRRSLRVVPEQLQGILDNLQISNMDFSEFVREADSEGVFRGFA
jgi:hypothetical protein